MADVELKRAADMAYREAVPDELIGDPVLLVHGFPQSSYMWRHLIPALATAGRRVIAPDLPGYGDSPLELPGTWERHVEALERFRNALDLERLVLVNHDWGGWISMACTRSLGSAQRPGNQQHRVLPRRRVARPRAALRTEGQGEALVDSISREGLATMLGQMSSGFDPAAVDEYWKAYTSEQRRRGMLELFRSGDLEKLEPYAGRLGQLGVPTLVLWGENDDEYAPVERAHRFGRELPDSRTVVVEGAGHFVWEDDPERCSREVVAFLDQSG